MADASPLAPLVRTFGPFLIPAVLFAVGVCFYALLFLLNRWRDGGNVFEE